MSLKSEYDAWHQRIHEADPAHEDALSPWYQLVQEYLGDVAGLKVLEVACGRGGFTTEMARRGAQVVGCDFSGAALLAARSKISGGIGVSPPVFVQADAHRLPFVDRSFDVIISCETIEHLPDVRSGLREMNRVCRVGGRLLLTTPNYANLMGLYELYARVRHPGRKDDQPFDRRQWFVQIRRWVRGAGWSIRSADGAVHQFPVIPGRNPLRWKALERMPRVRRLLSPFAYTYFVVAEKK